MSNVLTPLLHIRSLALLLCIFMLSGCSLLPGRGPSSMDIALMEEPSCDSMSNYVVVPINSDVVEQLGSPDLPSLGTVFEDAFSENKGIRLGIGDDLLVNIWEASGDGLFSTFDRKQVRINVTIDESGKIYIPYVGHIVALGKDIESVRKTIENGLVGKAVEPQVQVSLSSNVSNNIAIVGDIAKPGQYPVPIGGIRLIEAVALAGGAQQTTFDTEITIVREKKRGTARLDEILNYPMNNVWLIPQDTIQVINKPRTFTAFGAISSNNHLPFKTETVSLAEALAQSGGLNDRLADAGGVFLFRFESPLRLHNAQIKKPKKLYGNLAATIYRLDFKQPQAFFHASSFLLQDKDIIYVANAPAAEFNKFMSTVVLPTLSAARSNAVVVGS